MKIKPTEKTQQNCSGVVAVFFMLLKRTFFLSRISFSLGVSTDCLPSPSSSKKASCVSFCLDREWVHYANYQMIIILFLLFLRLFI